MSSTASPYTPTPRSPDRLAQILSRYPILESILSYSHRPSIISLAHTCRTLHFILTATIGRLRKPFPRCTEDLKLCDLCQTLACKDCTQETRELLQPVAFGVYCDQYNQPVNINSLICTRACLPDMRQIFEPIHFCEVCLPKHDILTIDRTWILPNMYPLQPVITHLRWEDVPQADRACQCNGLSTGCEELPHLAMVEYGCLRLAESEFVGYVKLPLRVCRGLTDMEITISVYALDMLPVVEKCGVEWFGRARDYWAKLSRVTEDFCFETSPPTMRNKRPTAISEV